MRGRGRAAHHCGIGARKHLSRGANAEPASRHPARPPLTAAGAGAGPRLDALGVRVELQVAQHHDARHEQRGRVGQVAAGNVGRGAVHRLHQRQAVRACAREAGPEQDVGLGQVLG